jgi:hypothetical protein
VSPQSRNQLPLLLLAGLALVPPARAEWANSIVFDTQTAPVQQGLLEQGPNFGFPHPFVFRDNDPGMDHLYQAYTYYNNGPERDVEAELAWQVTNCEFELGLALYLDSFNPADPTANLLAHSWEGPFHSHNGNQWNDYRHSPGYYRDLFQAYYLDNIRAPATVPAYATVVVVVNSRVQPGGAPQTCPTDPGTAANLYLYTENLVPGSPGLWVTGGSDYEYGPNPNQGGTLDFYVWLSHQIAEPVSVDVSTADGVGPNAAIAGVDYVATTETITFVPGQTVKVVQVPVIGDSTIEPDRTMRLVLSNPNPAALNITTAEATGTILDDDDLTGTCHIVTPASLPSGKVGVAYGPIDFLADGREGSDPYMWSIVAGGTPPGVPLSTTVDPITSEVLGRLAGTPTQAGVFDFTIRLVCPQLDGGSDFVDTPYSVVIEPEAPPVIVTLDDAEVLEGNSGTTDAWPTIHLSSALDADTLFEVILFDNSATLANDDYVALPAAQMILVNAGITELPVPLQVVGDLDVEPDEVFYVQLRTPVAGEIVATGMVTIVNDDKVGVPVQEIPTLSSWGALLLIAALAGLGVKTARR